jgi:hypothetical protein
MKRRAEEEANGQTRKKRKNEGEGKDLGLKIMPGESLAHFNRCVRSMLWLFPG